MSKSSLHCLTTRQSGSKYCRFAGDNNANAYSPCRIQPSMSLPRFILEVDKRDKLLNCIQIRCINSKHELSEGFVFVTLSFSIPTYRRKTS